MSEQEPGGGRTARQFVNPPDLHGHRSFTNVIRAGSHVYVTAQLPMDEKKNVVAPGDIEEQTRYVWRNIEIAMKSVGGTLADIVQCTTHITKVEHNAVVSKVRSEVFPFNPPTTSRPIVVEAVSPFPGVLVSIGAVGIIAG